MDTRLGPGAHRQHAGGAADWCISRQRTWGVPIALFVHNTTGEIHPDTQSLMEQVAVRMESQGIDAWFDLDPAELLGNDAAHYEKVTDTLDVWFDSGVTHECVLREREGLVGPPTCTSRDLISTADGSSPHCSPVSVLTTRHRIVRC